MRQYTFDNNNKYTGFLDSVTFVENSTVTKPATSDHKLWNSVDDVWEIIPPIPDTLETVKANKVKEARDYFNEIMISFEDDAAKFEIATWEIQRSEWISYIANPAALTPYCDMLATTREITRDDLMAKVGYKVVGVAQIQGNLHKLEDVINACLTIADVNLVVW